MVTELKIPEDIFEQIVTQAKAEVPIESCGILAGKGSAVEKIYKMTNADNSSTHFMMEPEEQFAVIKDMRVAGLDMLATYHSHPKSPARPSQEDIRMAFTPGVVYVIISLQDEGNPVIKGFNIEEGTVTEVAIKITKDRK